MLRAVNPEFYRSFFPGLKVEQDSISVFDSVTDEYNTLSSGAAFRDLSGDGIFEITGADSLDFLHRISTNDLKGVIENRAAYTIFTNEKGRMIDRALVGNTGSSIFLVSSGVHFQKMNSWLNKYIIAEDIKISIAEKYFLNEISGKQASSFLVLVFGSVPEESFTVKRADLEGIPFYIIKAEEFGAVKYYILGEKRYSETLFQYMMQNKMIFDFRPVGTEAYEIFRIEKGIPKAPNEIDDQFNPNDSLLIKDVSFTKGCYIGQEVIARLDTYGKTQRILCAMVLDADSDISALRLPVQMFDGENNEAGVITSAVHSPYMRKNIGMGYVKSSIFADGKVLKTAAADSAKEISAVLRPLPMVPPRTANS